jgi:uracil phosphoribosyltransferase
MLNVLNHPLITHKLTQMRQKDTGTKDFRQNLDEIAGLMAYEITRDVPTRKVEIMTPVAACVTEEMAKEIVLVPILRAGLGMVNGIRNLVPTAKVGHIGLYRDEETLEPHEYFAKFPSNLPEAVVMVLDPMLATGGSASAAITMIKKRGATLIKLVCLVGAPEGVKRIEEDHPDVEIYLAALDEKLNEKGYIVPGLGDAGDRIFGTK